MFLFGIAFLLYFIRISAPKGIWFNLRTADPAAHKVAITYQRHYRKVMKAELDVKFLLRCRDAKVYPVNVKWKILRKYNPKERAKYYERNLRKSIAEKNDYLRTLRKENDRMNTDFRNSFTWMKYTIFKLSIKRLLEKEKAKTIERHNKKLDKLIVKKALQDGVQRNPNKIITNLTGEELSKEEIDVLTLGLKHGIAMRPKEEEIIPVTEAFYARLSDLKIIKDTHMASERIKNALRSFAYNMMEIDDRRFFTDSKMLKIIRNLKERMVIVKPDKGMGIVLIKKCDYINSLESIFNDESKFKKVDHDPTLTRIGTIKAYINTMMNRGEITDQEKRIMRPKGAVRARARGMPKTHKPFDSLPSFRPVIDTMNTPYNGIGQFLTNILQPLTQNKFAMKDSFQAAEEMRKFDFSLLSKGYSLVSFDVVSLFTNVPLNRTIKVILKRIYHEKLVDVKLRKSTLKKLIHDCCTKTTFSFNEQLYEQIDGVCMGSSLGPTIANIIMTELEKDLLPKLIETGVIKSYIRYVDDTLVMIKSDEVEKVLKKFNSFDENLKFTVDKFEDGFIHFIGYCSR